MNITLPRPRRTTVMHRMTKCQRTSGLSRRIVGQQRPHIGLQEVKCNFKEVMRKDLEAIKKRN